MIQVGEVLDKYELLERVGQGGMAVVYRGLDRSLKRTVAVKVLHRHLADSREARDRFEREAHAVAKLRHDNILEIYAYGGVDSVESYIVTEFIDGVTLKQFITDHPLAFPELGAMIVLQIARALAHAHAAGILHRDVKPENVMIRSDGVVKLTDFGISQMVDLQRLTVTGQLLGSPAYMAPEHVEGQPLDFRTDVFACGTVLYQLTTGKLPFEGKNPHEILKRIAECKFPDPRQVNPRIGNELGKIILRCMARLPDERYPSVGELVAALERYLTGSGLGPAAAELGRFFQAPASYEMALTQRLVDHLSRAGAQQLHTDRVAALHTLDRVLTLDPAHEPTLRALAQLSSRQRWRRAALVGFGVVAVTAGALALRAVLARAPAAAPPPDAAAVALVAVDARPTPVPMIVVDAAPIAVDAAAAIAANAVDAREALTRPDRPPPREVDAGVAPPATVPVTVRLWPPSSEIKVGDGPWQRWPGGEGTVDAVDGGVPVTVRAERCYESESRVVRRADAGKKLLISLPTLPATIIPRCAAPGVQVKVDGRIARLDSPATILFGDTTQTRRSVRVEFTGDRLDVQQVEVGCAETGLEVTCALP
ncbi:MAG: protein kinase [Kofleriaceae bacterium]